MLFPVESTLGEDLIEFEERCLSTHQEEVHHGCPPGLLVLELN